MKPRGRPWSAFDENAREAALTSVTARADEIRRRCRQLERDGEWHQAGNGYAAAAAMDALVELGKRQVAP